MPLPPTDRPRRRARLSAFQWWLLLLVLTALLGAGLLALGLARAPDALSSVWSYPKAL